MIVITKTVCQTTEIYFKEVNYRLCKSLNKVGFFNPLAAMLPNAVSMYTIIYLIFSFKAT